MPGGSKAKASISNLSHPHSIAVWPLVFKDLPQLVEDPSLRWELLREGIEISLIYSTGETGPRAAFLRYAPGARLERHRHGGYEHILVLSGSQIDDRGEYQAGTLIVHPPGSSHSITSPNGCLVLAIWEKSVAFDVE